MNDKFRYYWDAFLDYCVVFAVLICMFITALAFKLAIIGVLVILPVYIFIKLIVGLLGSS